MENLEVIHVISRKQLLSSKSQFDISDFAKEFGFAYSVFITDTVNSIVEESLNYGMNDREGVLTDILVMLRYAIKTNNNDNRDSKAFTVYIMWKNSKTRLFKFFVECGPVDIDDLRPALTIMYKSDL